MCESAQQNFDIECSFSIFYLLWYQLCRCCHLVVEY